MNDAWVLEVNTRLTQLEKLVHYPNTVKKEQEALYAPLRSNVKPLIDLATLARRMLDPNDLGHAVSFEVRELARKALGLETVG